MQHWLIPAWWMQHPDFKEFEDTPSLDYHADDTKITLEETVAQTLVSIAKVATEYESVPASAFHPHKPLLAHDTSSMGSINHMKPQNVEEDHASEVGLSISCTPLFECIWMQKL